MKVLHVLNELKPSGAESMLRVAAGLWHGEGIACEVLSTGAAVGSYACVLQRAGYPVHHLTFARGPAFLCRLHRLCRDFDVVHIHTEHANFAYGLCAVAAGARVVRTVHSTFEYTGALRAVRAVQRRTLNLLGVQHVAIGDTVRHVERTVLRNATVAVSNWFDAQAYRTPDANQRRTARAALGIGSTAIVLVVVGNCSRIKNHATLIRAVAELPPRLRASLLVLHVGSGDDEVQERALAAELGVARQFSFLGQLPSALVPLQAADAFVMSSLKEGFPVAALEALGCGLPLLLTAVPGLRDLNSVTPAIAWASAPTPGAVAVAMSELMANLDVLGEQARSRAQAIAIDFGAHRGVRRYAALYAGR